MATSSSGTTAAASIIRLENSSSVLGLSVTEFGAVGDAVRQVGGRKFIGTDNSAAIQRAIDAAQVQGRTLLIPAGNYLLRTGLVAHCSAGSPPMCSAENKHVAGYDPAVGLSPLVLVGEDRTKVQLVAGAPMDAMLTFAPGNVEGGGAVSSSYHTVKMLRFEAMNVANHAVFAADITHSRFVGVEASDAKVSAISLQHGWCCSIEDCSFNGNMIGLAVSNSANALVVRGSYFEGGGIGMTIQGSAQALVIGNTIEGNLGPGIIAVGVRALQITANYFEANCQNLTASPATLMMNTTEGGSYLM